MKKILSALVLAMFISGSIYAQDKSFRFGLSAETSLNWMKPDNEKKFSNDGIVPKFGYGLILEFSLGDVASLSTGLSVNNDGGKIAFTDSAWYFLNKDSEFISTSEITAADTTRYLVNSRTYKNQYITLPLLLKMKTNEIGAMTYYGQFGFLTSINIGAKVDDNVTNLASGDTFEAEAFDNKKDIQFLNLGLSIGAGAEINLSGSTSFVAGLNVVPGFMNIVKKNSEYLVKPDTAITAVEQQANSMKVSLLLAFLF